MLFNSIDFLIFFPIVIFVYFIIPAKIRYIWLLIASYFFYASWNPRYVLLIFASTLVTYFGGLLIERCNTAHKKLVVMKKLCVVGIILTILSILVVFKYSNFLIDNVNHLLNYLGIEIAHKQIDLLLPVGISFYTFQTMSYTMDVYRGKVSAERNILKYALFVSFFPQLVAGPIERSTSLLWQVNNAEKIKVLNFERIRNGLLLMLWGGWQKLVIADRAAILVREVYSNYSMYGFVEISLATFLFAFQIYCDFNGYTCIACGAAETMGFHLVRNFKQPYLASNIKDFWRRWHISLTSWFTDYLYVPLGGNQKGVIKKYINIFIVFTVSGLWHGASWNYIAWGGIHAVYRIIGDIRNMIIRSRSSCPKRKELSVRIRKVFCTFVLVCFAWIFFAADSFSAAVHIIHRMFSTVQTTSIYGLGLNRGNWFILLSSLVILLIVDMLHEYQISVKEFLFKQELWFRWILYMGVIWSILLFGIYGTEYDASQFIYFQF